MNQEVAALIKKRLPLLYLAVSFDITSQATNPIVVGLAATLGIYGLVQLFIKGL